MNRIYFLFPLLVLACCRIKTRESVEPAPPEVVEVERPKVMAPPGKEWLGLVEEPQKVTGPVRGQDLLRLVVDHLDRLKMLPSSGNPDQDFALALNTHQKGRLALAQLMVDEGKDPRLQAEARDLIQKAEADKELLDQKLDSPLKKRRKNLFTPEFSLDRDLQFPTVSGNGDDELERNYVVAMRFYNKVSTNLAGAFLKSPGKDAALQDLARKLLQTTRADAENLEAWRSSTR